MPVRHLREWPADRLILCRKSHGSSVRPSDSPPEVLPPSNEPQEGEPAK